MSSSSNLTYNPPTIFFNGIDFNYLSAKYNFNYIHHSENIAPIGFSGGRWKEYLKRLLTTCELYPNEWFLLFEEDVNTLHNSIIFPDEDFSGVPGQLFYQPFNDYVCKLYPYKSYIKYNTCGGCLIKMQSLVDSINSVLNDRINLYHLNSLDNRILEYFDVLLSAILHLNGCIYGEWKQLSEISSNVYRDNPVFDHSWKEFYDYNEYNKFRKYI